MNDLDEKAAQMYREMWDEPELTTEWILENAGVEFAFLRLSLAMRALGKAFMDGLRRGR